MLFKNIKTSNHFTLKFRFLSKQKKKETTQPLTFVCKGPNS